MYIPGLLLLKQNLIIFDNFYFYNNQFVNTPLENHCSCCFASVAQIIPQECWKSYHSIFLWSPYYALEQCQGSYTQTMNNQIQYLELGDTVHSITARSISCDILQPSCIIPPHNDKSMAEACSNMSSISKTCSNKIKQLQKDN